MLDTTRRGSRQGAKRGHRRAWAAEGDAGDDHRRRTLREELERIRRRGSSISQAENVEGVYGFAAPVRSHGGEVVAAVHISTLEARASTQRDFLIERMCARAHELSRDLGGY